MRQTTQAESRSNELKATGMKVNMSETQKPRRRLSRKCVCEAAGYLIGATNSNAITNTKTPHQNSHDMRT